MKPYVIGAILIWFTCGIIGAWMLGRQTIDLRMIAGGPVTLYEAFDKSADD